MLLKTKGIPVNINQHLVGKVTRNPKSLDDKTFLLSEDIIPELNCSLLGIISCIKDHKEKKNTPIVFNTPSLDHLNEGDIISIDPKGNINTLYRINSPNNTLLATERCNSNCLMCSQPPKDREDIPLLYEINKQVIGLIPKDCFQLGISGGEPTLMGSLFFDLLNIAKSEIPNTSVHVLTNGRSFAWNEMAEKLAKLDHRNLILGIPLYSDYYQVHDFIVQAKNAFYQTILGLHNLARYNQRIELRIVLHKQTIPRLSKLAKYIYKNLPFVEHVAFMGLEYIGYTPHNIENLWIDPYEFRQELSESVEFLALQGIHVSIYNLQLCILPENLWKYSRKSISDWKNEYLPECSNCKKLDDCGGLFRWNLKKPSKYISAFY